MRPWTRKLFLSPRAWIAAGTVCIGLSFVVGYHIAQKNADRALARKVGQAELTLIQEFTPDRHLNLLREARVLGQIDPAESVRLNVGKQAAPRWIMLTPIYAVGRDMLPLAAQHLNARADGPRRPVPRAAAPVLAAEARKIAALEDHALAFAIEDADSTERSGRSGVMDRIGVIATDGTTVLVEISGATMSGNGLQEAATDLLLAAGISSMPDNLLIEPAASAHQGTDALEPLVAALRRSLALIGAALVTLGFAAPFFRGGAAGRSRACAPIEGIVLTCNSAKYGVFQPIATQDELTWEEVRISAGTERLPLRGQVSRMAGRTLGAATRIRNPR